MSLEKPIAVVVGFIGKLPLAGTSLYNLHHVAGLQALGYDVHYVERLNRPHQCYNPRTNTMTDDPQYAVSYLENLLSNYGITRERFSFIDRENRCLGSGWASLCSALDHAHFVLALADATWFDELERCPQRAFVDGDPLFTQVALLEGDPVVSAALKHYGTLYTIGVRLGQADCTIPPANRVWLPARSVVATHLWDPTPAVSPLPVTSVMSWAAGQDVWYDGKVYGHKNREFERFVDLPQRTAQPFQLAIGGSAPRERLYEHGWHLVNPLGVTGTIETYQAFIAGSWADFGIAKHAYVASRSGWFSDRSTCYLAAGRPVLHQDTGFSDWLPTGEGVFSFSDIDGVLEALDRLSTNYERHARAARAIAEEYFEAAKVVAHMLDDAGFR
jgi:hypothetical protein